MPTNPTNNFLASSKPDPLIMYVEKFGYPFPRPTVVKFAANMGAMAVLRTMLEESVKANKSVEDWHEFGLRLQERIRQRYPIR